MNTPSEKAPAPPVIELRDLERLIEFEVKQRDDRERAQGWTPWLLAVTICALLWRLVESTGTQDWPVIGLFWGASILLIDMAKSMRTWFAIEGTAEEPTPRFFAANWLLAGSRGHLALIGAKLVGAAVLVYHYAALPPPMRWFWLVFVVVSAAEMPIVLALSYSDIGIKALTPHTSPSLRIGLWLRWIMMLVAALLLVAVWWVCFEQSLTHEGLKTGLLMIGIAELATVWSELQSGPVFRESLLQLRRAIGLGELTVEDAKRRLDELLHGAELPQFLAKDIKSFDQALADLSMTHASIRTGLAAITAEAVKAPPTLTAIKVKMSEAEAWLKKALTAQRRLVVRTAIVTGQDSKVEREMKEFLQRKEAAVAEAAKVQAELTQELRRRDPPPVSPSLPIGAGPQVI